MKAKINDPVSLSPFWAWFEALSPGEQAQALGPVMNKLRALLRPTLRGLFGAPDGISLAEAMARRRIVLLPLPPGVIGSETASLAGSMVFALLWQVIQARASIDQAKRYPFMVYVDEFQTMTKVPTPLGDVLAQARGLGVSLTLANQHLGQLSSQLRQDVLANTGSKLIFRTGPDDARVLARDLPSTVSPESLQALDAYELVASLTVSGRLLAPVSVKTNPLPEEIGDSEQVKEASRSNWGVSTSKTDTNTAIDEPDSDATDDGEAEGGTADDRGEAETPRIGRRRKRGME